MMNTVSVIIPAYNEEQSIKSCLESLEQQSYKPLEIIVIDDGSTDQTLSIIKNLLLRSKSRDVEQFKIMQTQGLKSENLFLFEQKHLGPGPARNLGAKEANGEILVFVDADMTFDENFIKDLTKPIIEGKTIGAFSKNEMVANSDNIWSICWNINRNVLSTRMLPKDYPNLAPVYRAILKKEFDKVGGFDQTGEYTDDWSLSRKLGVKSTAVKGAVYYHCNPSNLEEVFKQARWIGKNEFISGSLVRKIRSLFFYSFGMSLLIGVYKSLKNARPAFLPFKVVYDFGVWLSVARSFMKEPKYK